PRQSPVAAARRPKAPLARPRHRRRPAPGPPGENPRSKPPARTGFPRGVAVRQDGVYLPTARFQAAGRFLLAEYIYTMRKTRKAHGDKVILDDVTLSFLPGAKIGVVGPHGAGNAELVNLIARFSHSS